MTFISSLIPKRLVQVIDAPVAYRPSRISLQNFIAAVATFDVFFLIIAAFLPNLAYRALFGEEPINTAEASSAAIAATALFSISCRAFQTYSAQKFVDFKFGFVRHVMCVFITFAIMLFVAGVTKTQSNYSRFWFFSWMLLVLIVPNVFRWLISARMMSRIEAGDYIFKAMSVSIIGDPLTAGEIRRSTSNLVKVVETGSLERIADLSDLADIIARNEIDHIYVRTRWVDAPAALVELRELRQLAAEIFVVPDDARVRNLMLDVGRLGDRFTLSAVQRPIDAWGLWIKRMQDIVVASGALLFFSPVMLLVALAIKLDSNGPVLFRQKRVGFNGNTFELLKFRSMRQELSCADASVQTSKSDPRVTRVGRIIRRTSVDEFPQFLNVLQGTMSIVGPRPHALDTRAEGLPVSQLTEKYAARHRVKPGLTGLAQVNGYRGELDSAEKVRHRVEHDIEYIENWSTWLDIKIILKTALLIVYDPHAY